ncbi:MAG TPA: fibronectin type III domain-containing protein [Actinotalea sp.]|nr:fibronectin type III domain-containing protein [Actinotalea sp.]
MENLELREESPEPTPFNGGGLRVTWSPPADSGGVPITSYLVSLDGGAPVSVLARSHLFAGVSGGPHSVTVVAVNARGASSPAVGATAAVVTVPQRPTIGAPDVSVPRQVTFTWQAGGDGGSPIVGWWYELSVDGLVTDSGQVAGPALVVGGAPGQELSLVVRAVNAEGQSAASPPATATVPDEPRGGGDG